MAEPVENVNKREILPAYMDAVQVMDVSMFDTQDVVNLILQRAQVLYDVPRGGALIRDWSNGDASGLIEQAEARPKELIYRAIAIALGEYMELRPKLEELSPRRVADIGAGYGLFDVFLSRDLGVSVLLIDIEQSQSRQFGFKKQGAAYSNLARAEEFAFANGVEPHQFQVLNPDHTPLLEGGTVDMAVSFLSCGFHYPVSTYLDYFEDQVRPDGQVILDLRAARFDEQMANLQELGSVEVLSTQGAATRVLLRKAIS